MDYEFRIKHAELELAHLREMQALHGSRLDAHDQWIEAARAWFDRVMETINRTSANLDLLTIRQMTLEEKIDRLIESMLRSRNGGPGGQA